MLYRTAVVKADGADSGVVENVIVTDDGVPYAQEDGYLYINSSTADVGDTYADGIFTPPPVLTPHGD